MIRNAPPPPQAACRHAEKFPSRAQRRIAATLLVGENVRFGARFRSSNIRFHPQGSPRFPFLPTSIQADSRGNKSLICLGGRHCGTWHEKRSRSAVPARRERGALGDRAVELRRPPFACRCRTKGTHLARAKGLCAYRILESAQATAAGVANNAHTHIASSYMGLLRHLCSHRL